MEGLESKAVLIIVRIAFVLVFLGERENSDMTVSGSLQNMPTAAKGSLKVEDLRILLWIFP